MESPIGFCSLLAEFMYNWNPDGKPNSIIRTADQIIVGKLIITPTTADYKTFHWELKPEAWEKLNLYLDFMEPLLENEP